jgi:hypothetical protein
MNEQERPRKDLDASRRKADRGRPATPDVRRGTLKGKPVGDQRQAGPEKASVAAARRAASESERSVSSRRELPLPMENPRVIEEGRSAGSLRLRLRVEGERVTVVSAVTVDAPAPPDTRIRGTTFIEVRAGDRLLTVQPLVDPGLAIGIPDPKDTTEFRGHRIVERASYELVVRVPIEAVDAVVARGPDTRDQRDLEITLFRAPETLDVEPREFALDSGARGRLAPVASSGRLTIDEVRSPTGAEGRKTGGDQTAS